MIIRRLLSASGLLVAIAFGSVACTTPEGEVSDIPPVVSPSYKKPADKNYLAVGDRLELFVAQDPSFNGVYNVRERGDIIIPEVGRIQLAGLSVKAAEGKVQSHLEKGQIKGATVILDRIKDSSETSKIAGTNRILVYMTGAVQKPGQHMLTVPEGRTLGVFEALLISGGLSRFADEQKVHILRMDKNRVRHRIPVNIRLIRLGEIPDPAIGEGDVVMVPEKVFGF